MTFDDYDDQIDDAEESDFDDDERYSPPRHSEPLSKEKREFGHKCKLMMDLLAVNGLPHEFEDAKAWVRLWPRCSEPTVDAAEWIEDNWYPGWVRCFLPSKLADVKLTFTENGLNLYRLLAHGTPEEFETTWTILRHEGMEFFEIGSECEGQLDWLRMSDEDFETEKTNGRR